MAQLRTALLFWQFGRRQSVTITIVWAVKVSIPLHEGLGGDTYWAPRYGPEPPGMIRSPSRNCMLSPRTPTNSMVWEAASQEVGSGHTSKIGFWLSILSRTPPAEISSGPRPAVARSTPSERLGTHVARGDSSTLASGAHAAPKKKATIAITSRQCKSRIPLLR